MFSNQTHYNQNNSQDFDSKAKFFCQKNNMDQSTYSIASQESTQFSDNNSQGSDDGFKQYNTQNSIQNFTSFQSQIENLHFQNKPQMVLDYAPEIFDYLKSNEAKFMPNQNYMHTIQKDVTEQMRAILIDWLVDVHLKFKLLPETLYFTVNIIDRYLGKVAISRKILQLVGVTSLLIACKYEEVYIPELREFAQITEFAYSVKQILDLEGHILSTLQFDLTFTSSNRFLERYAYLCDLDERNFNMTRYIIELALLEYKMIKYQPSLLASSAIYLVIKLNKLFDIWPKVMISNTSYLENDLVACATDLLQIMRNADRTNLHALKRKFSDPNYNEVSKMRLH